MKNSTPNKYKKIYKNITNRKKLKHNQFKMILLL